MINCDCPEKMDKIEKNHDQELVDSWDVVMPSAISEVYAPVSCIERTENKERYVAEHKLDASKVIVVCARGEALDVLRAESDVMDILVLGCIPRKLAYCEQDECGILVREYVNGESLGGALSRIGTFSEDEVRTLGEDLCVLISELYERNLSVKPESLSARNIIISQDGRMRFVEPEGIEFCHDFALNWSENEQAIGRLMNYLLTGDENKTDAKDISPEFRRVILKTMGKKEYGSVSKLLKAIEATDPVVCRKRRSAAGIAAVAAVLALFILVMPLFNRLGITGSPKDVPGNVAVNPDEDIPDDKIPADQPEIQEPNSQQENKESEK